MRGLGKIVAAATTALALAAPAAAQQVWTSEPDARLATMRGGFQLPSGLVLSFGIARTVQIDGAVASRTTLRIPDLQAMTAQQAGELARLAQTTVVQHGPGNQLALPTGQLLPGLVVQNTENGAHLQALTVIDVTANSLRMLQDLNLGRTLADGVRAGLLP